MNAVQKQAHVIYNKALRDGVIKRKPCCVCGKKQRVPLRKVCGHHVDYERPLHVVWLCPLHHKWAHGAPIVNRILAKQIQKALQ